MNQDPRRHKTSRIHAYMHVDTHADGTERHTVLTGQARRPHHDEDTRDHIARVERVADQQREQGWMMPRKSSQEMRH